MDKSKSNSQLSKADEETRDLQGLLDAFASVCSLEEIGSAYCSAKGDANAAGVILFELQNSRNGHGGIDTCNDTVTCARSEESVEGNTTFTVPEKSPKPRKITVRTGTVSSVLGKPSDHIYHRVAEPLKETKPLKFELKEDEGDLSTDLSVPDIPDLGQFPSNTDVEEFVFSMLHDGFNLDNEKTRDVLRSCGYDVKKSMTELLQLSSLDSVKGSEKSEASDENSTDKCSETKPCHGYYPELTNVKRNKMASSCTEEQSQLSMALLSSFYSNTKGPEEKPKRVRLKAGLNRTRVVGQKVVSAPLDDIDVRQTNVGTIPLKKDVYDKDKEEKYEVLRQAAKQNWDIMKAYFESAFDAFANGHHEKAKYLLEQGKYYNKLAREADEKSAAVIMETKSSNDLTIFTLDLHMHHTKGAVSLLKQHLCSLARIPTIACMKVIVDSDAEDVTKGRRKRGVIKLLENEGITWTADEGNPGTILIKMDLIDPTKLSFAKTKY